MLKVRIATSDAAGKSVVAQEFQLGVFAEQGKLDFVNYDAEGEMGLDWTGESCRAGMRVDVLLDSEVFELVGKDTGLHRSSMILLIVCRETGQSVRQLGSADHAV
jgi:hypothetical protein